MKNPEIVNIYFLILKECQVFFLNFAVPLPKFIYLQLYILQRPKQILMFLQKKEHYLEIRNNHFTSFFQRASRNFHSCHEINSSSSIKLKIELDTHSTKPLKSEAVHVKKLYLSLPFHFNFHFVFQKFMKSSANQLQIDWPQTDAETIRLMFQ